MSRPPADLYGRQRADRMFRALVPVVGAFRRASERGARRQPPVRAVDRDLRVVVRSSSVEADGVVAVTLADPGGAPLPGWRPGCHLDVVLPSGLVRQYSLCGDPADRRTYRIAVRSVGAGSAEAHALTAGTPLVVRGPRNAFPFVGPGPYLFIAGGIGITPILPMVHAARGSDWRLVYTGRDRRSLPFLAELPTERVRVRTDDEHGVPTAADLLRDAPPGAAVYCCGPAPLIDLVKAAWPGRFHAERFAPPPVVGGRPFELQLGVGGPVVPVAADETALTALRRVRPDVAYSCRQGFCGTCRVRVLSGGPSEEDGMLVCVARADGGRVVLDV
ncbi:PDR/VanB family oxidoreductase [Actinokineospora fastidiosa]|uniref:Oxidoreductase n=1 Tax=Actinokineospora fastidiosa TaxID=1816 RepID=A0A918G2H1_9PSEU|nr:PDR/VanB family oxidoreductase [Actinokineospora fastidiosa]GGS14225.1 putative oxidoreductase [Actinokineospora fastidiosa]